MKFSNPFFLFLMTLCLSVTVCISQDQVINLVCEYEVNPLGIDVKKPRLSWQILSNQENVKQTAYEIRVADSESDLTKKKKVLWTSQKTLGDQSVNLEYQGPPLKSGKRAYWQVRVWNNKDQVSDWSEVAYWEMGILETETWKANWITKKGDVQGEKSLPAQYYRKEFTSTKKIKRARVYVSSLGLYQLFLNGQKVSKDLFTPGYTSFHKRLQYQTYDVTGILEQNNTIGAIVGDGWYRGFLGWNGQRSYYGDQLALLIQLKIDYTDGTSVTITTENDWKVAYGPIQESDIYNGELYDARLEMEDWEKQDLATANGQMQQS